GRARMEQHHGEHRDRAQAVDVRPIVDHAREFPRCIGACQRAPRRSRFSFRRSPRAARDENSYHPAMKRHSLYRYLLAGLPLLGGPAVFAADAQPGMTAVECEVWNRERSFADSVDKHDRAAFTEHVHADAVFGAASASTQRGRDAILKAWSGI